MIKPPLFSIITVTLDNLAGLRATHTSLTSQNFNDYEWIVIDGGSSDGSSAFLRTTTAAWISEPDSGIYDAMNKGIERASGEYMLFLNAGDTLAQDRTLEMIANRIREKPSDFLYGDSIESGHLKPARPASAISRGMFTHHQAMLYRTITIGNLRYEPGYKIAGDYDFTLRFLRNKARSIKRLGFPVCAYEKGGISQTNAQKGRAEEFEIRRKQGTPLLQNAALYAAKSFAWALRQNAPRLYWKLKTRSSGNNRTGAGQI